MENQYNFNGKKEEEYFENQFESILRKTIGLENWRLPGTSNIEANFLVPEGYWLQMEDGIRSKTLPKTSQNPHPYFNFQLAGILGSLLILMFASYFYMKNNIGVESWNVQLEKIPQEEMLAFVDFQNRDVQEYTEKLASANLNEMDLPKPSLKLNVVEIEQALEEIQQDDFTETIELN